MFGALLILLGLLFVALPWLPAGISATLPAWVAESALGLGLGAVALGLLVLALRRRRPSASAGDGPIRHMLADEGLRLVQHGHGWQAFGSWEGVDVAVRLEEARHAGRFGRAWVLLAEVAGRPRKPWPLPANRLPLIEQDDDRFVVVIVDAARLGAAGVRDELGVVVECRAQR